MTDPILHIASKSAWSAVQQAGAYTADSLASEGFIHCSKIDQVLRVANSFFPAQGGLVLLVIDPARLNPELRWEAGTDKADELFPHIYGPVNLEAVISVLDFEPGEDGRFAIPPSLKPGN